MSFQSSKRALSPTNAASEPSGARRKLDVPVNSPDEGVFEICDEFPKNISRATFLLATIVSTSTAPLNPEYKENQNAKALLDANPDLLRALQSAWTKKSFQEIRNMPILQATPPHSRPPHQEWPSERPSDMAVASQAATVASWAATFVGTADEALIDALDSYIFTPDPRYYARFASIVQSSGMGKSRMIDQVAKSKFVMPFNLRKDSDGYPPADAAIKEYFFEVDATNLEAYSKHCTAFLISLFRNVTALIGEKQWTNAAQLRDWLGVGGDYKTPGTNRVVFYSKVTAEARKISSTLEPSTPPTNNANLPSQSPSRVWRVRRQESDGGISQTEKSYDDPGRAQPDPGAGTKSPLKQAAEDLLKLIEANEKSPLQLLIAFDEAEQLAEPIDGVSWTRLSLLQRVLRQIRNLNIFTCALATTGQIQQFTPPPGSASSARLQEGLLIFFPPFAALGFDQLAVTKNMKRADLILTKVTETEFIVSLGRPLFASRFFAEVDSQGQEEVRTDIVGFAADKLLCVRGALHKTEFNSDEKFAIFAARLPLEFNAISTAEKARETKFVEKHMRICLDVARGFESVTTVSASEPLLAEAAELLMRRLTSSDVPRFLLREWESGGLSKGKRGEMVAALIFLLARDRARQTSRQRYISVPAFFSALVDGRYAPAIMNSFPYTFRTDDENKTFSDMFNKSYIWFNHFINVEDFLVINRKHLWGFIARGCSIICADNQYGVDIIIPIVFRDEPLEPSNTSAIFVQVRNRRNYSTPKHEPFNDMDPWDTGMLAIGDAPLPMIRILFSMDSDNPTVHVWKPPEPRVNPTRAAKAVPKTRGLTTYDIWLGGVSGETLYGVTTDNESAWKDTLKAARDHRRDMFISGRLRDQAANLTRAQYPLASVHPAHWSFVREDWRPNRESD